MNALGIERIEKVDKGKGHQRLKGKGNRIRRRRGRRRKWLGNWEGHWMPTKLRLCEFIWFLKDRGDGRGVFNLIYRKVCLWSSTWHR